MGGDLHIDMANKSVGVRTGWGEVVQPITPTSSCAWGTACVECSIFKSRLLQEMSLLNSSNLSDCLHYCFKDFVSTNFSSAVTWCRILPKALQKCRQRWKTYLASKKNDYFQIFQVWNRNANFCKIRKKIITILMTVFYTNLPLNEKWTLFFTLIKLPGTFFTLSAVISFISNWYFLNVFFIK